MQSCACGEATPWSRPGSAGGPLAEHGLAVSPGSDKRAQSHELCQQDKVVISVLNSFYTTSRAQHPVWGCRKDTDKLEQVQRSTQSACPMRTGQGTGAGSPADGMAVGAPSSSPSAPTGCSPRRWSQAVHSSVCPEAERQWHKLKQDRFRPDRRNVFPIRTKRNGAGCAVSTPGSFQAHIADTALSHLVWPYS